MPAKKVIIASILNSMNVPQVLIIQFLPHLAFLIAFKFQRVSSPLYQVQVLTKRICVKKVTTVQQAQPQVMLNYVQQEHTAVCQELEKSKTVQNAPQVTTAQTKQWNHSYALSDITALEAFNSQFLALLAPLALVKA